MYTFQSNVCHERILRERNMQLAFDPAADYGAWKASVIERFRDLIGDMPEKCDLDVRVEWEKEEADFIERRMTFDTEIDCSVPCHLLLPKSGRAPYPVVICLQGHSTGMHISLGRMVYPNDRQFTYGDEDFALQIVKEGYAALVLEQRDFGERKCDPKILGGTTTCNHDAKVAALLGRTLIGERAWDVSRAVDMLETLPEIDKSHIALMGLSGGGTATYYAGALEPRLKVIMPAGAVCAFDASIGVMQHCVCNYIPRMAKYFDMGEIACMIAPRPLIVVSGDKDPIFLIDGVRRVYSVIEEIYKKEGAPDNCRLIVGDGGHRFYADLAWGRFREAFLG